MFCKSKAFTMAEILISLTIIGIIAAITLPSLVSNINEKAWATQRKALHNRLSQAIGMLPSLNGYGDFDGVWGNNVVTATVDNAAASFLINGLGKEFIMNQVCTVEVNASAQAARESLKNCGFAEKYTTADKDQVKFFPTRISEVYPKFTNTQGAWLANPHKNMDTRVAAFVTRNGESVAVFYNPSCVSRDISFTKEWPDGNLGYNYIPWVCASFVFDLNGVKGPNTFGKDMWFMTALYSIDTNLTMVSPENIGLSQSGMNYDRLLDFCTANDSRFPTEEEVINFSFNAGFANVGGNRMKGVKLKTLPGYSPILRSDGIIVGQPKSSTGWGVRCIKRN